MSPHGCNNLGGLLFVSTISMDPNDYEGDNSALLYTTFILGYTSIAFSRGRSWWVTIMMVSDLGKSRVSDPGWLLLPVSRSHANTNTSHPCLIFTLSSLPSPAGPSIDFFNLLPNCRRLENKYLCNLSLQDKKMFVYNVCFLDFVFNSIHHDDPP